MDGAGNLWISGVLRLVRVLTKGLSAYKASFRPMKFWPHLNIKEVQPNRKYCGLAGTRMAYQAYRRKALQAAPFIRKKCFNGSAVFFPCHLWCQTDRVKIKKSGSGSTSTEEFRVNGVSWICLNFPKPSNVTGSGSNGMAPIWGVSVVRFGGGKRSSSAIKAVPKIKKDAEEKTSDKWLRLLQIQLFQRGLWFFGYLFFRWSMNWHLVLEDFHEGLLW